MKSRLIFASIAAAVAIASTTAPAAAQFTTFVPPPKPVVADTASRVVAAAVNADSVQAQAVTDMKVWVDSAARALAVNVDTAAGPAVVDSLAGDVLPQTPQAAPTTTFREGAPAPDTATMFPMLALVAVGCLGAGLVLLRRSAA